MEYLLNIIDEYGWLSFLVIIIIYFILNSEITIKYFPRSRCKKDPKF